MGSDTTPDNMQRWISSDCLKKITSSQNITGTWPPPQPSWPRPSGSSRLISCQPHFLRGQPAISATSAAPPESAVWHVKQLCSRSISGRWLRRFSAEPLTLWETKCQSFNWVWTSLACGKARMLLTVYLLRYYLLACSTCVPLPHHCVRCHIQGCITISWPITARIEGDAACETEGVRIWGCLNIPRPGCYRQGINVWPVFMLRERGNTVAALGRWIITEVWHPDF